jgi:hypothetical protein
LSSLECKVGSWDALYVEMWNMYIWKNLARRKEITHLHIESDAKILVNMVIKKQY